MYGTLSSALAAGSTNPRQSAITQWGLGLPHLAGRYRPGALPFRPHFVGFVEVEGFLMQRWAPILPACGGWLY